MAALSRVVLVALLVAPAAGALSPAGLVECPNEPEDCPVDPRVVGDALNPLVGATTQAVERETGENLTGEDVGIDVTINVTNADIGMMGIILGGGAVEADFTIRGHFEFRAISLARVDEMLRESTGALNVSPSATFGVNASRVVVTAEEFRLIAGGALLEAFRAAEERAAERYIESSLPGVDVVSADFRWSNVAPAERARDGEPASLTEPPLVLDADLRLRFVERVALTDLLGAYFEKKEREESEGKSAEDEVKDRIKENQTLPLLERSAFMIIGIDRLLALEAPPGWRLKVSLSVPRGFTIEGATDALVVSDDKRSATVFVDGSRVTTDAESASVVTLSNRALVVVTLLVATLAVGLMLRALAEAADRELRARRARRTRRTLLPRES